MPVRTADAEWKGTLQEGTGHMRMATGAYEGQYSFSSRFEEGVGTNPEELIAAAHAGCFSMSLAGRVVRAEGTPESIRTTAKVRIEKGETGFSIMAIELDCEASVSGLDDAKFQELVEDAKQNCPVSKALAAVPSITVSARLV